MSNIRCADETVILAGNIEDFQELIEGVSRESEAVVLPMSIKETKYMVISTTKIVHDGTHLALDDIDIQVP